MDSLTLSTISAAIRTELDVQTRQDPLLEEFLFNLKQQVGRVALFGGAVRDSVLKLTPNDLDFVVRRKF